MQGLVSYPGVENFLRATYTLDHGITPGVCMIELVPQTVLPQATGSLTFSYGNTGFTMPDCRLDVASIQRDERGYVWAVSIFDRRWRWKYGECEGHFNRRNEAGELVISLGDRPRDLAEYFLARMGETNIDVSAMPNDIFPEMEGPFITPAAALANLCELVGCRVVLGFDGRVTIERVGEGADIPADAGDMIQESPTFNVAPIPDKLIAYAGVTRFQGDWPLEAVGEEADGTIKPIDDLSYKPAGGWGASISSIDLNGFANIADEELRKLAKQHVFRSYRIKVSDTAKLEIPGYDDGDGENKVSSLDSLLPIYDFQVEKREGIGEEETPKAAMVHGVFWLPTGLNPHENSAEKVIPKPEEDAIYRDGFSVDTRRGIVHFSNQVLKLEEVTEGDRTTYKYSPADLRLRCAVSVRHKAHQGWVRYRRERDLGSAGVPNAAVRVDDAILGYVPVYSEETFNIESTTSNKTEVDAELDHYLDQESTALQAVVAGYRTYAGLRLIDPDGAIQQVVVDIGDQGTFTTIARNSEVLRRGLSYAERRLYERSVHTAKYGGAQAVFEGQLSKIMRRAR